MRQQIEEEIRQFLVNEVLDGPELADLPLDAPLLGGLIDSFGLVTLIDFVEERYEVNIGNDEMVRDNFRSVAALAGFIQAKRDPSTWPAEGPTPPPAVT